jgi:hypothetical protein
MYMYIYGRSACDLWGMCGPRADFVRQQSRPLRAEARSRAQVFREGRRERNRRSEADRQKLAKSWGLAWTAAEELGKWVW